MRLTGDTSPKTNALISEIMNKYHIICTAFFLCFICNLYAQGNDSSTSDIVYEYKCSTEAGEYGYLLCDFHIYKDGTFESTVHIISSIIESVSGFWKKINDSILVLTCRPENIEILCSEEFYFDSISPFMVIDVCHPDDTFCFSYKYYKDEYMYTIGERNWLLDRVDAKYENGKYVVYLKNRCDNQWYTKKYIVQNDNTNYVRLTIKEYGMTHTFDKCECVIRNGKIVDCKIKGAKKL